MKGEIQRSKMDTQRCRIDYLNDKNKKPPSFSKDTHVNLDMQMWITHNQAIHVVLKSLL